jgi:protein-L-isoaspartate O-methyltransferase
VEKRAEIMVNNQLVRRGIQDESVLRVMRETPRHLFVPDNLKEMLEKKITLQDGSKF